MGKAGKIVRLVRVMRVMRIFKLVRHFAGLQSLIYTLNQVSQPQLSSSCQLSFTPVLLGLQGAWVAHVAGGGRGPHICLSSLLRREGHQKRREIFYRISLLFSGQSCWVLVLPGLLLVGFDDPDYCGVSCAPTPSQI